MLPRPAVIDHRTREGDGPTGHPDGYHRQCRGLLDAPGAADIRHVAPELRCRPYVSTDSNDWIHQHPGMTVMREQGIVEDDQVIEHVAARMRVLAAPDSRSSRCYPEASCSTASRTRKKAEEEQVGSRDIPDNEFRVVLARRGQHWVSAVRVADEITVDDVAITDSASIASLVFDAMESIATPNPRRS
ncbi:ESX secretion-associated protein EspG, partial [Mycolicibacterium vaccae]|nr:ESX secretion-associated protein EspG [Mycolicibacterium vaccae]